MAAAAILAMLPMGSCHVLQRDVRLPAAAVTLSFWALHRAARGRGWGLSAVSVALVSCAHLFAVRRYRHSCRCQWR
ncbi:hypothetical protein AB0C18_21570 [Nonomuraea muscovyensis]|uniref:hypothetical protein n=1 Tax=Nonomuraea muscovyensis TaxID=1124761 RepID=UPI0033C18C69